MGRETTSRKGRRRRIHGCREEPLRGLRGQSNRRLISINEVKQHKTEGSIWTVLKGRVYNISPYMKFHPGGVDMLMKAAGKDCTSLFSILSLHCYLSGFELNSRQKSKLGIQALSVGKKDKFLTRKAF